MWKTVKLGDVCDLVGGGTPSKKNDDYYNGDIPWATVRDMSVDELSLTEHKITKLGLKNSSSKVIPENNVIIASRVGLGKVCILRQDTAINQDLRGVIPKRENEIDKSFLFYWFKGIASKIIGAGRGATVQGVTLPFLNSLSFPLPPLAEQQRIVAKLDAAFAEIDGAIEVVKNKMIEISSLYENSITADFINIDGCVEKKLSDVCEKITDGTHQTPKYFEEGYIFLSSKNVTSRKIDWENVRYIDESQHIQMQKRIAPRVGDVLLAKNGTTGVAAIVDRDVVFDIYVSLAWLRSKGDVLPEYLLEYVNSKMAREQFNTRTKGIGVPNLHLQEIREVVIRFPKDKEKQKIIVKKLKNIDDACNSYKQLNEQKLQSLFSLKSAILAQELQSEAA